MTVKLLTEHHLEFLSLKGGCSGSYKSTLVKMPHCWKSHVTAHLTIKRKLFGQETARQIIQKPLEDKLSVNAMIEKQMSRDM